MTPQGYKPGRHPVPDMLGGTAFGFAGIMFAASAWWRPMALDAGLTVVVLLIMWAFASFEIIRRYARDWMPSGAALFGCGTGILLGFFLPVSNVFRIAFGLSCVAGGAIVAWRGVSYLRAHPGGPL